MSLIIQPTKTLSAISPRYIFQFNAENSSSYINTSDTSPAYITLNDKSTVSYIFSGSGFVEPLSSLPGTTVKIAIDGLTSATSIGNVFSSSISSSGLSGTTYNLSGTLIFDSTQYSSTLPLTSSFSDDILHAYTDTFGRVATNLTGSATASFIELTGSLNITGSTTQTGNITLIGNSIISGNLDISGSSNFHNSIFIVTGSSYFTGSHTVNGSTTVTGSLNVTGDINVISGSSFTRWGNSLFNYISLHHTGSISLTQNVSSSFVYSTIDHSNGISVVSGSRITFDNNGLYNIQFSAQLYTPTNSTNVYIWFKKNGVNITNSATRINVGTSNYVVAAWNFIDQFDSGSYAEIVVQSDQTTTQLQYATASGNIPAIPSIITTVDQVA